MRIIGFQKKWQKLSNHEFTTFRFTRRDKRDWQVGELVQVVYKPRRKGGGEVLGIAKIINKEKRELDKEYFDFTEDGVSLITDDEAIEDGFLDVSDMVKWLEKIYGRLDWMPRMNKLTLKWIKDEIL